jgi:hypothetical protein
MIMSCAAHRRDFGSLAHEAPSTAKKAPTRAGILRRILDAFADHSRQRDVDRQIASFLAARSAERLTDDLEREISLRLLTSNWSGSASLYGERRFP